MRRTAVALIGFAMLAIACTAQTDATTGTTDFATTSTAFNRRVDAERYLVTVESDKLGGRYADPRLARTRLEDWITEWEATRTNLSPLTRIRDEGSIRNHVLPRFGHILIGQLQPVHRGFVGGPTWT